VAGIAYPESIFVRPFGLSREPDVLDRHIEIGVA
jgi:hypothetical protein